MLTPLLADMAIMNEHLLERTKRSSRNQHSRNDQADVWILPPRLNTGIREYVEMDVAAVSSSQWLQQPEVPSSAEILDIDVSISTASGVSEITPNRPVGAWEHKGMDSLHMSLNWSFTDEIHCRGIPRSPV